MLKTLKMILTPGAPAVRELVQDLNRQRERMMEVCDAHTQLCLPSPQSYKRRH